MAELDRREDETHGDPERSNKDGANDRRLLQ